MIAPPPREISRGGGLIDKNDRNRSRADCALGQGALRQRTVLSFTTHQFDSLRLIRKIQGHPEMGCPCILVEPTGIEPVSKNPLI